MSRLLLTAAALSLALGTAAQAAKGPAPVVGKNPTADISDDQALGCFYRMVVLSNDASDAANKPGVSEADRKSFLALDDQASRGVTFYITILYTRPWVADRSDQLAKVLTAQRAEDKKTSDARAEECLNRSLQAQVDVFGAAVPAKRN